MKRFASQPMHFGDLVRHTVWGDIGTLVQIGKGTLMLRERDGSEWNYEKSRLERICVTFGGIWPVFK